MSGLVRLVGAAADDLPFFITGAAARDLILQYGYGIDAARKTHDVDFAFMVETWPAFEALRSRLLATGKFAAARRFTSGMCQHMPSTIGKVEGVTMTAWQMKEAVPEGCGSPTRF